MSHAPPQREAPVGYLELLRTNADFRLLWFGQIVSLLGDWFNLIASASLIAELTGSGLAVGSLFVVRMLAPFLTSPLAGVVADRYNRKRILILSDLARGFIVLGFLCVRTRDTVWLLYALTALQLGVTSFYFTTRNAILPDIVASRALGTANAIGATTWSVMLAVGAAVGGFASGTLGNYAAFAIDAATFFVSAAIIAGIRSPYAAAPHRVEKTLAMILDEYVAGLRYLRANSEILAVALQKAALTMFFGSTLRVVQVAISERIYVIGHGGGIAMGLLFAVAGIGTGVGPIVTRRFTGDDPRLLRRAILAGYGIGIAGLCITAPMAGFGAVLAGSFLTGVGNGLLWVFSTQILLEVLPGHIRGRVFATEFALFTLAAAFAAAVVGAGMDSRLGISGVLWSMATLSVVPGVVWGLWLTQERRRKRSAA